MRAAAELDELRAERPFAAEGHGVWPAARIASQGALPASWAADRRVAT
jgi:hypothetical protein